MKLATQCYIENDGRYLMLHRIKKQNDRHKGLWMGLGGKFEPGESPEDCVKREVLEECGLTVVNPRLRGVLTFPGNFGSEDWYVFLFTASDYTGQLTPCAEGELEWIEFQRLDALPMHEGDRYFLKWIRENEGVFSAKYTYKNGALAGDQMSVY